MKLIHGYGCSISSLVAEFNRAVIWRFVGPLLSSNSESKRKIAILLCPFFVGLPEYSRSEDSIAAAQDNSFPSYWGDRISIGGDARIREELNFSQSNGNTRNRMVVRGRLSVDYDINASLSVGARLVTGDADDPNTSDVTLSNFVDDIPVALDQFWLRYKSASWTFYGGKFPQLFKRTDMVWDGDVNPQGVGSIYSASLSDATLANLVATYMIIDEDSDGANSDMWGFQPRLKHAFSDHLVSQLSLGYYSYQLNNLASADDGDFRSNVLIDDGYASDFELVDLIVELRSARGINNWPIGARINVVKNLGATNDADLGFSASGWMGDINSVGYWRVSYLYEHVEVDAVYAAFSHDNLSLATNYWLSGLNIDYKATENVLATLNWYHYKALAQEYISGDANSEWLDRVRLNLQITF